jgi:alpha-beta hydrolase superfamily lysophospholipase
MVLLLAIGALEPAAAPAGPTRTRFDVRTVRGETVRVSETISRAALKRKDRRVIVLVPGTIGVSQHLYEPPFAGYDAAAILARAGYITVTMDLPGFGASTGPADGAQVTGAFAAARLAPALRRVARRHGVARVDVYGEAGSGTGTVLNLARRARIVRTVTGAGVYYLRSGTLGSLLTTRAWKLLLDGSPRGYLQTNPALYPMFFTGSPPALSAYMARTLPGAYPTGFFQEAYAKRAGGPDALLDPLPGASFTGPITDPAPAKVPALFLQGGDDLVAAPGDTAALASDYGRTGDGHADAVTLPGGTHFLRLDVAGRGARSAFWRTLIGWLDAH